MAGVNLALRAMKTKRQLRHRGYFTGYRIKLGAMIGQEAAGIVTSMYKWTVLFVLLLITAFVVAATADPGRSMPALAGVVVCFLIAPICVVRMVRLSSRGADLASSFLTKEWGQTARIKGVKLSLWWWRWRINKEKEDVRNRLRDADVPAHGLRGDSPNVSQGASEQRLPR
jgi:hypothetical protein